MAEALVARQRELGLEQQELAARSGVSAATLRKLQSGTSTTFRTQTLARVSEALEWPPDALFTIGEGGPAPRGGTKAVTGAREARLASRAARLAPHELRAVERLIEDLLKGPRPADRPTGDTVA